MSTSKLDTSAFKGAHTGKCYAGLRFQPNYKEYMYVKLTEPLEKGLKYYFSMYVRLLGISTVSVKQLGVYFSDDAFKMGMVFDKNGIIDSTHKTGISASHGWVPITGQYIARGGEKFIIIGNFKVKMKEDFVRLKKWDVFETREAYYYIDDISVIKEDTVQSKLPGAKIVYTLPDSFVTGEVIEIKNIQFENGSATLLESSYKVINELVILLKKHPATVIQINGHTDNTGDETANMELSNARAKTVYDYLLEQHVLNSMKYRGFGSSRPIAPNDSDENKAKNRRVEILIIKQ